MKILKYSLLFFSIIGLTTFFSCGGDDPDPTVDQLISNDGKAWQVSSSTTDTPDANFRLTFTADASNATSFTLTSGSMPSPAFNSCSATSGSWSAGGAVTNGTISGTVTFTVNGVSSTVTAEYVASPQTLTLSWNTPEPDNVSESGCGDKNNTFHSYVLTVVE